MNKCLACGTTFASKDWPCPQCHFRPTTIHGYPAFAEELNDANASYNPDYYTPLVDIEKNNFWFTTRNRLILWAMERFFPKAQKFMEIGCGTGFVLSTLEGNLKNLELFGSDIFTAGLQCASRRLQRTQLLQMDSRKIPFYEEFDCMGAFDVLEHIDDDEMVLAQIHQALKRGGGLLVTVPRHKCLWSQFDVGSCHIRRYSSGELIEKMKRAGFKIVKATSFMFFLFPITFLSRVIRKKSSNHYNVINDLKYPLWLNRILEKQLLAEMALIRAGISFPWGSTLLVVAQKV